ncbi:hypothetical protein ABIC89_003313 [Variovorax boronicumulans]|uniref:hypothetical protein n=1 Tax=Variovorax boronicumulans TaxID=436515 RepID=UPI0033924C8A
MLFLPFDGFGAYDKGVKDATAENWADIFNTEKASEMQRNNDMADALYGSTVDATRARNQYLIDGFPLMTATAQRQDALGAASQPGALARATSGSDMAVDYSAQLQPQISTINANLVGAAVAGSGNQLAQQQGTARTQEMAAADAMWTQVAPQLAELQTAPGNEVALGAQPVGRAAPHDAVYALLRDVRGT